MLLSVIVPEQPQRRSPHDQSIHFQLQFLDVILHINRPIAMVSSNRGFPEPPNDSTDNNLSPNNEIVHGTDTDTEEEADNYEGYQPLPMNAEEAVSEESDPEEDAAAATAGPQDLPPIVTMEETLLKEVWTGGASKDIEMDSSRVDAVKRAMVNITLPASSIPEWANNVPEEEWKAALLSKIQNYSERK